MTAACFRQSSFNQRRSGANRIAGNGVALRLGLPIRMAGRCSECLRPRAFRSVSLSRAFGVLLAFLMCGRISISERVWLDLGMRKCVGICCECARMVITRAVISWSYISCQ
jgi:hypothetical protein